MENICACIIVIMTSLFAVFYAYQIRKHKIDPTLSTWIIFMSGVGISLITYTIAENKDFKSGILNKVDAAFVLVVISAIFAWGKRELRLKPFEKWYLLGVLVIIVYGILSKSAWNSNVLSQVLLSVGYIPTIHHLIQQKKNRESFLGWGCSMIAAIAALYLARVAGKPLETLYASRALFFAALLLCLMFYYEIKQKK